MLGRMPWSSNATFLVCLSLGSDQLLAIYKPQRGERPLWDFPRGTLCNREVAAREVSEALGWAIVPDTVLRDGPVGIGMMQRFVHHDPEEHYFTLLAEHGDEFRRMAAFDIVINNTDRKGGHCLRATETADIFGIDHGVSFHAQWKVRTVIWDFACEPIPPDVCADLHRLSPTICAATSATPRPAPRPLRARRDAGPARVTCWPPASTPTPTATTTRTPGPRSEPRGAPPRRGRQAHSPAGRGCVWLSTWPTRRPVVTRGLDVGPVRAPRPLALVGDPRPARRRHVRARGRGLGRRPPHVGRASPLHRGVARPDRRGPGQRSVVRRRAAGEGRRAPRGHRDVSVPDRDRARAEAGRAAAT